MNRGKGQVKTRLGGYTIVETLIFLAVSATMFLMAMGLIRGQQNKTEFTNSTRELESRLAELTNNMATGYYQNTANFSCSVDGSNKPVFSTASKEQGSNKDCILVGTVIKFNSDDTYDQFTMAGARKFGSSLVTNLFDAQPQAVYEAGGVPILNVAPRSTTLYGSKVGCIAKAASCTPGANTAAAIGIFASLSAVGTGLDKQGSSVQSDLIFYPSGVVDKSDSNPASVATKISSPVTLYDPVFLAANQNPLSGVTICLLSGTTDQYALLHLGGQTGVGNKLAITTEIKSGSSCS